MGISIGIDKLDRIFFIGSQQEFHFFLIFFCKGYTYHNMLTVKVYVRAEMLISVVLRMQKYDHVKVNIIALKLQV